ncbi:MAG: ABC transporter substrate-binding protein [Stackebrandtia sp.]
MSLRNRTAATTAALALTLTLTACGGSGPAEPLKNVDGDDLSGSVNVWSWDVAATALKRLVKDFEAEHPDVDVKVTDVGYDNAADKLSVGLKSGTGLPDLVTVETQQMQSYIGQFPDGFAEMTGAAKKFEDDMDPSKWEASSSPDDKLYALPWDSGTAGLFYRTDLFAKADVDANSIETWDDLIDAGKKVKKATGAKLLVSDLAGSSSLVPLLMQQQGVGYFDDDGDITLDSPEAETALDIVTRLNEAGLIHNEKGWDALVRANKDGTVAAEASGVWWAGTLTSEMPELKGKFGAMPLPAIGDGEVRTSNNGGSGLAVPAQAENPDAAWAFTKFALTDTGNQVSMMMKEGLFPSYLPSLEDPFFSKPQKYFGDEPVYEMFGEQTANIPPIQYTEDFAQAGEAMTDVVPGVVVDGDNAKNALTGAADRLADVTGRDKAKR